MKNPVTPEERKKRKRLFIQLIAPVILTIGAFVISIYVIFIPTLERNLVKQKKEMIRELTQSAISILDEAYLSVNDQPGLADSARNQAFSLIENLRYGEENKDYFWVINQEPRMLVHPFRPELKQQLLNDYTDPQGKRLFVESVKIVNETGSGFLDYFWQWKDDSTRIVPKLSYVEEFKPWGLIVGTGIYLNDVDHEITLLKRRLGWVSLGIVLFVTFVLFFFLRTGYRIEKLRQTAENKLEASREKYRSLVEASREGTLMSLEGKINYVNARFLERFGYLENDILGEKPDQLFSRQGIATNSPSEALQVFDNQQDQASTLETVLITRTKEQVPVIISVSKVRMAQKPACIFIIREMAAQDRLSKEISSLSEELQTSLLLMNQPISLMAKPPLTCRMDTPIRKAAELMKASQQDAVLILGPADECLGIVTDRDLRNRVIVDQADQQKPVYSIMSSPLVTIPPDALLYEAMLLVQRTRVTHLALADNHGHISGILSHTGLLHLQQNTTSFLMKMIQDAQTPEELIQYSQRTAGMIKALEQSGAKTIHITRISTAISDALTSRFCDLAVDQLGPPETHFALLALGSEGRGEQTLATDQDNAIVFQDVNPDREPSVKSYFMNLGQKLNQWMNLAGYNLCQGGVMAGNEKWIHSVSKWKSDLLSWIQNPEPAMVLDTGIFMDFRPVYGDQSLAKELQNYIDDKIPHQAIFFYHAAQEAIRFKPGETDGVLDLKKLIFPLTNFARLNSLRLAVDEKNTLARLQRIKEKDPASEAFINRIAEAYDFLMMLRFKCQLRQIALNEKPGNSVNTRDLSALEKSQLKKVIPVITDVQNRLRQDFNL